MHLNTPSPEIAAPPPLQPRRGSPEQHHGGAWKVAYADFVTALMALFIVLWMMNSGTKVKQSVSGYFRDPQGYTRRLGTGVASSGEVLPVNTKNVRGVQDQIQTALRKMPEFRSIQNNVLFSVTGEGLRIDLVENEQGMFFVTGNQTPTPFGEHLLEVLAEELGKMPNELVIEGHTDARPFRNSTLTSRYTNWELAGDRANTARRILHTSGFVRNRWWRRADSRRSICSIPRTPTIRAIGGFRWWSNSRIPRARRSDRQAIVIGCSPSCAACFATCVGRRFSP